MNGTFVKVRTDIPFFFYGDILMTLHYGLLKIVIKLRAY